MIFLGSSSNLTRNRYSAGSELYTTVDDLEVDDTWTQQRRNTPVYAVPNKAKTAQNKRQTVHVSCEVDRHQLNASTTSDLGAGATAAEHIYSQVDKERKKDRKKQNVKREKQNSSSAANQTRYSDYDNIVITEDDATARDTNRNVKVIDKSKNSGQGAAATDLNLKRVKGASVTTPGYQTIGSVQSFNPDDVDGGSAGMFDPDYDTVQEAAVVIQTNECDDVDYESIPGSAAAMAMRVAAMTSSSPATATTSDATTSSADRNANVPQTEQQASSGPEALVHISQFQPRPMAYRRPEHIYEAISDDSAQGNVYSADPTRHVVRTRTQTQQRQFVTNL